MDSSSDNSEPPYDIAPRGIADTPATVYHYTNSAGLLGIINTRAIWASDVRFMNDTAEAIYGRNAIRTYCQARASASSREKAICESIIKILAQVQSADNTTSYIACLSAEGNDLSQWRAYGASYGISIGFDLQALRAHGQELPIPWTFNIRKVMYDPQPQRALIDHHYVRIAKDLTGAESSVEVDRAAIRFLVDALNFAPTLKHPAFKGEREFRIHVFLSGDPGHRKEIKIRDAAMGLIPYLKIPLCLPGQDVITVMREIVIGPQRHPQEAKQAVRALLDGNSLANVTIRESGIPLRLE